MPASKAVRQVASVGRLSQSGAKFADRRLGDLEQKQAQPTRDTPHACERAWLHANLKVEVYIPWERQPTEDQEVSAHTRSIGQTTGLRSPGVPDHASFRRSAIRIWFDGVIIEH